MNKKQQKRLIIVAVIIGIFLIWYFGFKTLSVLGEKVVAYNSYSWTDDNHLIVSNPSPYFGTGSENTWGTKHAYAHTSSNNIFCSFAGISNGYCVEDVDWAKKAQEMSCDISGTLVACFEGESCPQGEATGTFNIQNGIVTYEFGTLTCNVKDSDIAPFINSGSPLYQQWWSKPGRIASWSTLLVTSGTVTFEPCSGSCNQECPTGTIRCSDGTCKENCDVTPPNYLPIIIIILILVGITGGLYYLYEKTK